LEKRTGLFRPAALLARSFSTDIEGTAAESDPPGAFAPLTGPRPSATFHAPFRRAKSPCWRLVEEGVVERASVQLSANKVLLHMQQNLAVRGST
jgi:hypothetical protein